MRKTKYDHLTREDLISVLVKRDSERKLGLVWERDQIGHERALNSDFVALDLIDGLSVGDAPYQNLLIEGDNFDALRYLSIAYRGKIKCICIDPPYNTGNKDFIYNDKYIDKEDAWMHSKWLESLYQRLLLARDLLSNDGVIFVCIDDKNRAKLELLMDQVFPGKRVGTFVWRCRSGANDAKEWFLSVDHECVLCYANKGFSFEGTKKDWSKAIDDGDKRGPWVDGPLNQGKDIRQRPDAFYPIHNPATDIWYPCDPDTVWRFATKDRIEGKKLRSMCMEDLISDKRIAWPMNDTVVCYKSIADLQDAIRTSTSPKNLGIYEKVTELQDAVDRGVCDPRVVANILPMEFWLNKKIGLEKPRYKRFTKDIKKDRKPVSTWILPASMKKKDINNIEGLDEVDWLQVGFTSEGTSLLTQMVGNKDFAYPKPISLIKSLVSQVTEADSGDVILDFYAGSGTTGHAVMDCNNDDGGNRSFILVSSTEATENNPEKNVCQNITRKRLKAAIEGYSYRAKQGTITVEGLSGNFAYLRTRRISLTQLYLDIQHDQVWYALQLLHSQEVSPYNSSQPYQLLESNSTAVVYVPSLDSGIKQQILEMANAACKSTVIYTWQPGILAQEIYSERVCIEKIPDYLVDRFGGAK